MIFVDWIIYRQMENKDILSKNPFTQLKIRKNLNRYNSEDSGFRSTNQRSLEAGNLALWNLFLFISIRLPVPEISSFEAKVNF